MKSYAVLFVSLLAIVLLSGCIISNNTSTAEKNNVLIDTSKVIYVDFGEPETYEFFPNGDLVVTQAEGTVDVLPYDITKNEEFEASLYACQGDECLSVKLLASGKGVAKEIHTDEPVPAQGYPVTWHQ